MGSEMCIRDRVKGIVGFALPMILITGSGGLIGNAVSNFFLKKKIKVIGIENNQRKKFFGRNGDITNNILQLKKNKFFKKKAVCQGGHVMPGQGGSEF